MSPRRHGLPMAQVAPAPLHAVERLPNGLVHARDRHSGLTCALRADGSHAHGDLRLSPRVAKAIVEAA